MSTSTGQGETRRNTQAIASLALGVLSIGLIPFISCVPEIAGVLALIAGTRAIRAARETNAGRGLAIAGMVLGGIGLLVTGFLWLRTFTSVQL
jgi:hypothetical protein